MKTTNQHIKVKEKIQSLFTLFAVIFFISSCKKAVTVPLPVTQVVTANVFSSDATATAAQLGVYAQLYNWSWTLHRNAGLSADELKNYATDQSSIDLYTNSLNALIDGASVTVNFWSPAYNYIYQENSILENLQNNESLSPKVRQQLNGEASFIRAYMYLYLTTIYGDVPLVTTTNYKTNQTIARTAQSAVYQQIISDLSFAQTNLSNNFVDASDTTTTLDRVRPTSWAASALLARVYLYTGKYAQAEASATTVINNTSQFSLVSDLTQVFKMNSKEAIWQTLPNASYKYTFEGQDFILVAAPSTGITNSATVSNSLLSAFETGDNRKSKWINSYTSAGNVYYFPYKYRDNSTATTVSEYTMMLRLAEQYLIRAEARARQNNNAGAIADLNMIRNRAGLPNYGGATDQASLLTAISHERQVELFTEGHRWFDLKRSTNVDAVMTPITLAKGGSWTTTQQLYPIPVTDIQNDPGLVQNPGY